MIPISEIPKGDCSICLNELSTQTVVQTPCNDKEQPHYFHFTCLNQWVNGRNKDNCPLCKATLTLPPKSIADKIRKAFRRAIDNRELRIIAFVMRIIYMVRICKNTRLFELAVENSIIIFPKLFAPILWAINTYTAESMIAKGLFAVYAVGFGLFAMVIVTCLVSLLVFGSGTFFYLCKDYFYRVTTFDAKVIEA